MLSPLKLFLGLATLLTAELVAGSALVRSVDYYDGCNGHGKASLLSGSVQTIMMCMEPDEVVKARASYTVFGETYPAAQDPATRPFAARLAIALYERAPLL